MTQRLLERAKELLWRMRNAFLVPVTAPHLEDEFTKFLADLAARPKMKVKVREMPGNVWKWSTRFGETRSLSPDTYFTDKDIALADARRVATELGLELEIEE